MGSMPDLYGRLSPLLAYLRDAWVYCGLDMEITAANARAAEIFGYSNAAELGGFYLVDLVSFSDRLRFLKAFVNSSRGEPFTSDWRYIRSDGALFSRNLLLLPAHNKDGKPVGFICLFPGCRTGE